MPVFGLGVWQAPQGRATREAVTCAIGAGYRLIDTAALYQNEASVGEGVRASGVAREELFVTTKLWNDDQGFDAALRGFERSRRLLNLGAVDLYLVHWPVRGLRLESWRALGKLQREGACRSIGVSNFTVAHLDELIGSSDLVPAVNQVEFSPFLYQRELLEYCRDHGIQLEAYAPLTRGRKLDHPALVRLARTLGRSPAQVVLRWGLQHGVVEIPKSVHPERIRENAGCLDFQLSPGQLAALDALHEGFRTTWDPSEMP
ncbi:MAG: aldo/keto reductase [Thermoplasmata archaeon]|nr:aldo/keto reductase [Thermoplasmata archaeon]